MQLPKEKEKRQTVVDKTLLSTEPR